MSRRARRVALAVMVSVAVAGFGVLWALPNVAGGAFLHVRAIAEARGGSASTVIIGNEPAVRAGALDVSVEVDNAYPLSVVVGSGPVAYQAAIYRRESDGKLTRIWQASGADPALEESSDSPMGGAPNDGAAVVPPGATRHSISASAGPFSLRDGSGAPLPAGVYYLRVWAYGIGSPLLPLALDGGVDSLGPPSVPADLPSSR